MHNAGRRAAPAQLQDWPYRPAKCVGPPLVFLCTLARMRYRIGSLVPRPHCLKLLIPLPRALPPKRIIRPSCGEVDSRSSLARLGKVCNPNNYERASFLISLGLGCGAALFGGERSGPGAVDFSRESGNSAIVTYEFLIRIERG